MAKKKKMSKAGARSQPMQRAVSSSLDSKKIILQRGNTEFLNQCQLQHRYFFSAGVDKGADSIYFFLFSFSFFPLPPRRLERSQSQEPVPYRFIEKVWYDIYHLLVSYQLTRNSRQPCSTAEWFLINLPLTILKEIIELQKI